MLIDAVEPWKSKNRDLRAVFLHNILLEHTEVSIERNAFIEACNARLSKGEWPVIGLIENDPENPDGTKRKSPAKVYMQRVLDQPTTSRKRFEYTAFY